MAQSSRAGTGMTLLWAALAINGVNVVLGWYHLAFRLQSLPVIPALVFVFWLFLTSEISIGHTWPRIVYLAFIVVEVLRKIGVSLLPTLPSWMIEPAGASSTLALAALVLQVIGIALLLMGTPRLRGA